MYKATKEFRFEMAHVLTNYDGLCGNLHGHSYKCLVTFGSDVLLDGMVMDFSKVKELVKNKVLDEMDHAFAYNLFSDDPFENALVTVCLKYKKRMIAFPFRTTAENMSAYIHNEIKKVLQEVCPEITYVQVELYETTTGHATFDSKE